MQKRDVQEEVEQKVVKDETLTAEEQAAIEEARNREVEKFDAVEEIISESEGKDAQSSDAEVKEDDAE